MLQLNNLSCGYKQLTVLEDINLKIQSGEIFTFIGPNGSGKTTLLKTILGLLPPLKGEVKRPIRPLSMLESETEIPFSMTAKELFSIGTNTPEIFQWCLHHLDITSFLDKNILTLSSGQKRRVWLTHTLIQNSEIILIDEPFSHLDLIWIKKITMAFKDFKKNFSKTLVLVAHELEPVLNLSDRVGLLGKKQLLIADQAESVFLSPHFSELFAFKALIDENPMDRTKRLTLGHTK